MPMLSGLLLSFVKEEFMLKLSSAEIEDAEDTEQLSLHVHTDKSGRIIAMNQIHHYWFRSDSLDAMSFYDFCRFVCLECKREGRRALVPHVVGMNVPQKKSELEWALFTLSHFKPFSCSHPLIMLGQTLLETYGGQKFDEFATRVMNNWEAVHECAAIAAKSRQLMSTLLSRGLTGTDTSDECDAVKVMSNQKRPVRELRLELSMPDEVDELTLKVWKKAIQTQAKFVAQTRQNALNPKEQSAVSLTEVERETGDQVNTVPHLSIGPQSCAPTESNVQDNIACSMSEDPAK
ncbi:hypothetical protein EV424DRAFT_1345556 [Suillus variegatus]|nr:hypothetical protein EV424DRAFT_1345556 [Suillus variegatus]